LGQDDCRQDDNRGDEGVRRLLDARSIAVVLRSAQAATKLNFYSFAKIHSHTDAQVHTQTHYCGT